MVAEKINISSSAVNKNANSNNSETQGNKTTWQNVGDDVEFKNEQPQQEEDSLNINQFMRRDELPTPDQKEYMRQAREKIAEYRDEIDRLRTLPEGEPTHYDGGNLDAKQGPNSGSPSARANKLQRDIDRLQEQINEIDPMYKAQQRMEAYKAKQEAEARDAVTEAIDGAEKSNQKEETAKEQEEKEPTKDDLNVVETPAAQKVEKSKEQISEKKAEDLIQKEIDSMNSLQFNIESKERNIRDTQHKLLMTPKSGKEKLEARIAKYEKDLNDLKGQFDKRGGVKHLEYLETTKSGSAENKIQLVTEKSELITKLNKERRVLFGKGQEYRKQIKDYEKRYGKKLPKNLEDENAKYWSTDELDSLTLDPKAKAQFGAAVQQDRTNDAMEKNKF